MKELVSRQQHLRAATLGSLLGGVALFASGGGPARADDSGFQVSESGLKSKIIKEGTGAIPSAGMFWVDGEGKSMSSRCALEEQ